jgi:head-tail adaptor
MMDVGELKHRILLETISRSQNSVGQLVEVWTAVGSLWAKMEDATGSEGERDDIVSAAQKTDFTIRFRALNATDFRLVYNTQVFDIEDVKEEEFKKWLKVRCVKRSSFAPYYVQGGATLSVADFAWLWLTGLYFDSFKDNTFVPSGVNQVYSGMSSDFALITEISLPSKSLATDFTNAFFAWFDNLVTIDLNNNVVSVFETAELSGVTSIDLSDNLLTAFDTTGLAALLTLDLSANSLTAFDATETPLLTTIDLSNNLLDYLVNSQLFIDLDNNAQTDGTLTSTIEGSGFVTPTAVDAANSLILKDWNVLGVPLSLTSGVTYNVADFPKIWIDNLLYNTAENKGNTFVAASNYAMTGQVAYAAVTGIDLNNQSLTTYFNFLDNFDNLQSLILGNNPLITLLDNFDKSKLIYLGLNLCSLVSINIDNANLLEEVYMLDVPIGNIDFTQKIKLRICNFQNTNATNADLSNCTLLEDLNYAGNDLEYINIDNLLNLSFLKLQGNLLSDLNISNNELLIQLRLQNNQLDNLVNSQLLIDLDTHNLSNGYFQSTIFGGGTLTAAGITAKSNLLAKGWTIVGV